MTHGIVPSSLVAYIAANRGSTTLAAAIGSTETGWTGEEEERERSRKREYEAVMRGRGEGGRKRERERGREGVRK